MKHLMHLSTPLAFSAAFLMFGTPNAPAASAIDDTVGFACATDFYDYDEPLDSDGDGYPDDQDTCPHDPSNQCHGCQGAEHSVNVATGAAVAHSVAAIGLGFIPGAGPALAAMYGGMALFYTAGALYIQHVQNPECF